MQQPLLFSFVMLFGLAVQSQASELFFSFNQELQSFYLTPPNSSSYFGRSELQTKGDLDLLKNLKFKLDTSSSTTFMNKQDQKSFLFNPTQLGLAYSSKYFDAFAGGFTITADGADINNIFDVVNPQDYRQPFNTKAIGSFGILLTIPYDSFQLKAFYIPKNGRSMLPDTQSAWWPRTGALPISNSEGTIYVPENMGYKMTSESEHHDPFKDNIGASGKLSLSNADFSFFYYKGANQIPQISTHVTVDLLTYTIEPPAELNLTWYKSEHAGLGATFVFENWIFKGFCKNQKDFLLNTEESTSCTTAVESGLPVSKISVRYFLQQNRKWKRSSSVQELETLLGFFDKSTALGLYVDMNNAGIISGAFVYNEKDPSVLTSMGYEYRFTDQFKAKLTANILTTSGNSILAKAYDKTDNATVLFSYDF